MDAEFKHIRCDPDGTAWVEGADLKVIDLVMACQAYGWSPEEYHLQHPRISLAHICAALAYYYEHQADLDRQILADLDWADQEREKNLAETAALRERLRRRRQRTA